MEQQSETPDQPQEPVVPVYVPRHVVLWDES